jgi:hypothetical protein
MQSAPSEHPAAGMLAQTPLHPPPRVVFASFNPPSNAILIGTPERLETRLSCWKQRMACQSNRYRLRSLVIRSGSTPEVRK